VNTLPVGVRPYAKAVVAVIGVILTALVTNLDEVPQWLSVLVSILTALGVYATPNKDPQAVHQDESVQPPLA
jgi:hypothetical protein